MENYLETSKTVLDILKHKLGQEEKKSPGYYYFLGAIAVQQEVILIFKELCGQSVSLDS
jgi:hypothetical protein